MALIGTRKILRKKIERKSGRKIKNWFKLNKLILSVYSNSFFLFHCVIQELRNSKLYKFLRNFGYI